jgi:hypothetical protein
MLGDSAGRRLLPVLDESIGEWSVATFMLAQIAFRRIAITEYPQ